MVSGRSDQQQLISNSRKLAPSPVTTGVSSTTNTVVTISAAAVALVITLDLPARITALTVTGNGSSAVLVSYGAAPSVSYIVVPVAAAIDANITISLTTGVGGAVVMNVAEIYTATPAKIT